MESRSFPIKVRRVGVVSSPAVQCSHSARCTAGDETRAGGSLLLGTRTTSEIGTTSLQRTRDLSPMCPLFGGSPVLASNNLHLVDYYSVKDAI